ncbi:vitamin K-dependent gamma-carboxylase-like isoform X2 [Leptopilina boulardi]|nr:vitamin K-dependent gamma-carboxylase-like isoform X2 [Leptopilina boulardi]
MWKRKKSDTNCQNEENDNKNKKQYELKISTSKICLRQNFQRNFENFTGFQIDELTTFKKFVKLLYRPTDPSSLGVTRALFGLCMVIDIVHERGLSNIDKKWGDSKICRFPLIHGMESPTLPWMTIIYTIMWLGAFGIMLGYYFKIACFCFVLPYWYIFLLDKTFWNNHSYLYGIVAILYWGTGANKYFSIDSLMNKNNDGKIPLWNYFILRFQFFLLYFLAGLKKTDRDWLSGYSVVSLSGHWVFFPFTIILTAEQTNHFIVHLFGFIFDLTIGFWMMFDKTRLPAMLVCTAFHLMNTRLFAIGMFPYTCLATMPLFCHVDWPRKFENFTIISKIYSHLKKWKFNVKLLFKKMFFASAKDNQRKNDDNDENHDTSDKILQQDNYVAKNEIQNLKIINKPREENFDDYSNETINFKLPLNKDCLNQQERKKKSELVRSKSFYENKNENVSKKKKFVIFLLIFHIGLQCFLPYSHFITQGYNNWVPGLYGYSWNMMVNYWDAIAVIVQVHDNVNNEDYFINPDAYVINNRWWRHGDMVKQYAHCLKDNLMKEKQVTLSSNISIYVDVWCSLNGRFQQRMFKPNVDILTAEWHPLKPVSFLVPLLTKFNLHRYNLEEIEKQVYTWSNYSDVYFVADYSGMKKLNFVDKELTNVTLHVIEGEISYIEEGEKEKVIIPKGDHFHVTSQVFHQVEVISSEPACYMYTFLNKTSENFYRNNR